MSRLLKLLAVGAVIVIVAFIMRPTPEPVVFVTPVSVELRGPVIAGDPLSIQIEMDDVGGSVEIVAFSGGSVLLFTTELGPGASSWTAPDAVSETAGHLTLLVGEHQLDVSVAPGEPDGFTDVLVGPRTIVADGKDLSLAVVTPGDIYGNAMPAGTAVEFQRQSPTEETSSQVTTIARSIASTQLVAGTAAGANSVWVTMSEITGVPAVLNEVPGFASSVDLDLDASTIAADGREVIELATAPLTDLFGNELPDGVAGVFRLTTPTTTTLVPATVQQGRLRAFWTAPNSPQILSVGASVNGQTSDPEIIRAVSAVQDFDVSGLLDDDGYRVFVGPILNPSGGLVADGTEVVIGDRSTTTTDGRASALVQPEPGIISVSVLGRTVEHRIEP